MKYPLISRIIDYIGIRGFFMKKIVVGMDVGYCGMDGWEFYEVPDEMTEAELDKLAWDCAVQHAEMYGYYPACYYEAEDIEEAPDSYIDSIEGWWELYDSDKHDGYTFTGTPNFTALG